MNLNSSIKLVIFLKGIRGVEIVKYLKKKLFIIDCIVVDDKKLFKKLKKNSSFKDVLFIKNVNKEYKKFSQYKKNIFISAGFSQIFNKKIINIPIKFLNLHAGKLPEYRGGSPLNWQIINNEKYYTISVVQLKEEIDAGLIYSEKKIKLKTSDNIKSVHKKANLEFPKLLYSVLKNINKKNLIPKKQNKLKAIYWHQRSELDGYIDFNKKTSLEVHNFVRALSHPYDGAWGLTTEFEKVRIFKTKIQKYKIKGNPGHILYLKNKGINVICKDRAIRILFYRRKNKINSLKNIVFI